MDNAYKLLQTEKSVEEIQKWVKFSIQNIKLLNKRLKSDLHISEKTRIIATIAALKQTKLKIKNLEKHGGKIQTNTGRRRSERVRWEDQQNVFQGAIRTGSVINLQHKDLSNFFDDAKKAFIVRLKNIMKQNPSLKVNAILYCKFETYKEQIIEDTKHFQTKSHVVLQSTNLPEWFQNNIADKLLSKIEDFQEKDSGWSLTEIISLNFSINKYSPMTGSGGLGEKESTYIDLPVFIKNKKAVINIQNNDEFCFLWCVTAALYPTKPNQCSSITSSYPHFSGVLDYDDMNFPMRLDDIYIFEQKNSLSINVYGLNEHQIVPYYLSKCVSDEPTIHLLLSESENGYHYSLIKNLSRLVKTNITKSKNRLWFCDRCLLHFKTENSFVKHKKTCFQLSNGCQMLLPDDHILRFKNFKNKQRVPFAVYADLECMLKKTGDNDCYQEHVPFSVAFYTKCSYDDSLSNFGLYRGEDCIQWFLEKLYNLALFVDKKFNQIEPMKLTEEDIKDTENAKECHICEEPFLDNQIKHRDHDHLNSRYRGMSHAACNLNYKIPTYVPVVFHNLSGYDSHFIIKHLGKQFPGAVSLLPINKEKYISFTKAVANTNVHLRFIDSFRFMSSSIDKLSSYLDNSCKRITRSHCDSGEKFKLLTRKGVFCYDYVDDWNKLQETQLPAKEQFYSKLNNEHISEEDYSHAKNVWQEFNIQNLGEYSDLYLKNDVLLLSDIVENFRESCMKSYQLDPLNYCTAPGLAFDAMLKMTRVELELLTDLDKIFFIEAGLRGGISQCSNRYAEANNKYMESDYNPNLPTSYIMYFDVNNLYGQAMSFPLPYGGFKWLDLSKSEDAFESHILNTPDDSSEGYILEVDLIYPENLHDLHKDLPLAPEHATPPGGRFPKLLTTLWPKKNYVVHYRNLKLYLSLGMKIVKIHRILKFKQSPWLKPYIDLNTNLRKQAKNEFEKNFYKLMNNSVFGKTMENVRKYKDVRLVTSFEGRYGANALIAKPNFYSSTIISDDLILIEMSKTSIMFNKPIYVGFSILDVSKTVMYDFYYNYIKKTFNDNAKLLYVDTDSQIIQFFVDDIYSYIKRDIHKFDTSDYDPNNVYDIPLANKKVLGLMKDENFGKIMTHFLGIRSKNYIYKLFQFLMECKRSKGIKASALRKITFEDYLNCLFNLEDKFVSQNLIRSKKHTVYTIKQQKVALNCRDDKRRLIENQTDTLPWGYKGGV